MIGNHILWNDCNFGMYFDESIYINDNDENESENYSEKMVLSANQYFNGTNYVESHCSDPTMFPTLDGKCWNSRNGLKSKRFEIKIPIVGIPYGFNIQNITNQEMNEVFIESPELRDLPNILDGTTNLEKFTFRGNNWMKSLPTGFFDSVINLQMIDISHNKFTYLSDNFVMQNINLVSFDASNNQLQTIPDSIFSTNTKLKVVNISWNNLTYLPEKLLLKNLELEDFYANTNELSNITAKLFKTNANLSKVNFAYNKLEEFADGLFNNNYQLKHVSANDNLFRNIPSSTFIHNNRLEYLNITNNNCFV